MDCLIAISHIGTRQASRAFRSSALTATAGKGFLFLFSGNQRFTHGDAVLSAMTPKKTDPES
jgi:hypothetical protein